MAALYHTNTATEGGNPVPFVKWAGSKRRILTHVLRVVPSKFGTYFEPFLGSGALLFSLMPSRAIVGDKCSELIEAYEAIRDDAQAVIGHLSPLRQTRRTYYKVRANRSRDRFARAAEFIYLNKTCWNGLYRVNLRGDFNVPFGAPKTPFVFDADNLRRCSEYLSRNQLRIRVADFALTLATARKGDFVYLDPPYVTLHNNNGFAEWNESIFSWSDQERLARLACELDSRGVMVVVSNAVHRDLVSLYKGFKRFSFDRASTLASNSDKRGRVQEQIFVSRSACLSLTRFGSYGEQGER